MSHSLRLYLLSVAAPADAVAVLLLRLPSHSQPDPALAVVLVGLGAIAANFPVLVTRSYKADVTPAFELAIVVLFSPAAAVALIGTVVGSACLAQSGGAAPPSSREAIARRWRSKSDGLSSIIDQRSAAGAAPHRPALHPQDA